MLPNIPIYVYIFFLVCVVFTTLLFECIIRDSTLTKKQSNMVFGGLLLYMVIQGALAYNLFFMQNLDAMPPRGMFNLIIPFGIIAILFFTEKGKAFIDSLSMKSLTILSLVRIPMEFILYWLFLSGGIPEIMTFAGANFDIFAGITAILMLLFAFRNKAINKKMLIAWNSISLVLILTIVTLSVLSLPFPIQQLGLDQPNVAVLYFPFIWLPGVIVPFVIFSHLASLRQLTLKTV